jgi:oligopeptide/dipeptide ABC transporter ATP-binding protein
VHAVDDVSFDLVEGEILALVGESGCGKTSLAMTIPGLERASSGRIVYQGQDVTQMGEESLKGLRRQIQMIFQDPYESLNPTQMIGEIVAEPLQVHKIEANKAKREGRILRALSDAGLKPPEDFISRYPHELSGGQRQRVVIAAALVLEPRILLADEPVSMLDMSIRAEVLNLLMELRETRKVSILYITHDLGTVSYLADRVAVMYLGRIVELGPTRAVLDNPQHPYTQALLSVVPVPNPARRRERIILKGEIPNPIDLPSGCRFHPRCPAAQAECRVLDPPFVALDDHHSAACILVNT